MTTNFVGRQRAPMPEVKSLHARIEQLLQHRGDGPWVIFEWRANGVVLSD